MTEASNPQCVGRVLPAKVKRVSILLAGAVLPQVWLFGPSLLGQKVLLPVDLLARPDVYLPMRRGNQAIGAKAQLSVVSDLVYNQEPFRRFVAAELRAGRLPVWDPHCYAGAPRVWGFFSPFEAIYYRWPTPRSLPWIQLVKSLIAAAGAYLFFQRVLAVRFWPAAFGAWCFPITGFFVLWQGFRQGSTPVWLPWMLLATDRVIRGRGGWSGPGLALVTGLTILTAAVEVAGQTLLAAGFYAVWHILGEHGARLTRAGRTAARLFAGWSLGFLLSSAYLLPLLDYVPTGARTGDRAAGLEERAPVGLAALPQAVLPNFCRIHQLVLQNAARFC